MKKMAVVLAAALALLAGQMQCSAQDDQAPPPAPAGDTSLRSTAELDQLLQPIALYPDPLVALILAAATTPSQIVDADRYIGNGGDTNAIPEQPWSPSVQGLAHYPTVLKWMDDNITWTTELGAAFASQQSDVMDAIQSLRGQAQAQGNLQSTPQETVQSDDGDIDIEPADPDDIYVPYYTDAIYTQPGIYCTFGIGFPIGGWLGFDWDWRGHHLISWGPGHPRPHGWWQEPPNVRRGAIGSIHPGVWRPPSRGAGVVVAGGDRGYGYRGFDNSYAARPRAVPRPATAAPRVGGGEPGRAQNNFSAPVERSEPSESAFGGSMSSREVRQSSSRGEESRSMSFGGGGGERGGGGGGRR